MADATRQLSAWLERFGAALVARDIPAVVEQFVADCYWRDLVAFSWNLHTAEGRAGVRALLEATLDRTGPIALAEVQGYAYAALRGMAKLANVLGEPGLEQRWQTAAEALRIRFDERFWCSELSTWARASRSCRTSAARGSRASAATPTTRSR